MDKTVIREAGKWLCRAILCTGAVYALLTGRNDIASCLAGVIYFSFFFLD